ncbi:MAG: hypothetical protein ABL989_17240, partial [Gammaproteobacteria bacterium]
LQKFIDDFMNRLEAEMAELEKAAAEAQKGNCWNGEQGHLGDGIDGAARAIGNDLMSLFGFLGSMGTLSPEQHAANAAQFGSNNTSAGILGSDLAPALQLAVPVTRLGYVTSAARIPGAIGITAPTAVAMRNALKVEYRLGAFPNSRMGSYEVLSAGKTDAEIIASAGTTNAAASTAAATVGASTASSGRCK